MSMLRTAAIGLGWWANELAQAVQGKSQKICITTCYSRMLKNRVSFADKYGTATHNSYQAVLADEDVDAVLLCTPHSLHAEHVEQAARAGKHVFVEKPFTLTEDSGKAAAAVCADYNRVLAVGQNRRFAAATIACLAPGIAATAATAPPDATTPTRHPPGATPRTQG